MRIVIRFSEQALVGGNHGIDSGASAVRYAALLREAVLRDFPAAEIVIAADADASVVVTASGPETDAELRGAERAVLDLAWVVKQCQPWSVPL
jgi:hypothetical protein